MADIGSEETGDSAAAQASTFNYNMTASVLHYLSRAESLGAVEGPLGQQSLPRELRALLNAAHHVLAGGEVRIDVVRPGHSDIVNDLNTRWDQVEADVNSINERAGHLVVSMV